MADNLEFLERMHNLDANVEDMITSLEDLIENSSTIFIAMPTDAIVKMATALRTQQTVIRGLVEHNSDLLEKVDKATRTD